jgi:hypothetical protein
MSQHTIEVNLTNVLLKGHAFAQALFEYELQEHTNSYLQSKHADGDKYFFAITEHTNDVAMLVIDEQDTVHVNEQARAVLQELWRDAYTTNMQRLIPQIAQQLHAGFLFGAGVQLVETATASDEARS